MSFLKYEFDKGHKIIRVKARLVEAGARIPSKDDEETIILYKNSSLLGNGRFGEVIAVTNCETKERIAIKIVKQDKCGINLELEIWRKFNHPNIVKLQFYYFTPCILGKYRSQERVHFGMEFMPQTLFKFQEFRQVELKPFHRLEIKLCVYQILRGLGYIHALDIFHNDLNAFNILVEKKTFRIKLCDFGSSKLLSQCSGGIELDLKGLGWLMIKLIYGCVNEKPDNLFAVAAVEGYKKEEKEFVLTLVEAKPMDKSIDFMVSDFLNELRHKNFHLRNGEAAPWLFDFQQIELEIKPELNKLLVPFWMQK